MEFGKRMGRAPMGVEAEFYHVLGSLCMLGFLGPPHHHLHVSHTWALAAYALVVFSRAARVGLVLLIALGVMAWGTSPCMLFSLVKSGESACADIRGRAATASCECGSCESETPEAPPRRDTEDCPTCRTVGNMHAFPPVGARVALVTPVLGALALNPSVPVVIVVAAPAPDAQRVLAPPGMQFAKTVALLR